MSKYEKMIALNKQASAAKVELAKTTIWQMLDENQRITIPMLMERTGLSRGFFYKNPEVRRELDRALEQQVGMIDPRRGILDLAMDGEIELLREQLAEQRRENEELKQEVQRLKKALGKRNLEMIRGL